MMMHIAAMSPAARRKLQCLRAAASRSAEEEVSLALRAAGASGEDVARYLAFGTMDLPLRGGCNARGRRGCRAA